MNIQLKNNIILQGKIHELDKLQKCIDSIRNWFEGKLIVSTWEGQNILPLNGVDEIVTLKDPGAGPFNGLHPVEKHCNLIRQLVGLKEVLHYCNDGLIFKIRNDCLVNNNVFDLYKDETCFGLLSLFNKKIMIGNIMTINPNNKSESNPYFRASDWFYLGHRNDLDKLCSVLDIINDTDYSNSLLGTEHILAFNLLKYYKFKNLTLNSFKRIYGLSWDYILNNFQVKNTISSCGIINIEKWANQPEDLPCYLTESIYNEALNNYVNNFS